jgi:hypothetical protein
MSGMGMTMYGTGTETLTGTVSADRTAHLTLTRAFGQATMNVGGQSMSVPASEMDVPLDTPYDIKLQNGFTQNYNVPDFGTVTLTVRSGGASGQHKVTFTQTGVPDGTTWWVKVGGTNKTTTSRSITVDADDGTYAYQVGIACPASTEDFPLQLTQIRTTSSGAAATTQATVEDIVFVDGLATKPDSIGWYRFAHSSGTVTVNGADETVQLSAQEANVVVSDTITLEYSCPNSPTFVRGAEAGYERSLYASLGAETFDSLFPALLINHTGTWHVTAHAEITLSTLDYEQTITTESNTLSFYVDFTEPTTTLTVTVNGVNNALSMYTTTNGATASNPTFSQSGDGYDVSFEITGPSGNSGIISLTIPKTAVPAGFVPQTKINGVLATQQYTEDNSFYYVSFEAHFSTDQVTIHFSPQTNQNTPTPAATAPSTNTPTQTSSVTIYEQIMQTIESSGVKDKSLDEIKAETGITGNQNSGVNVYEPTQFTERYYARALSSYLNEKGWNSYEVYIFDSATNMAGVAVGIFYNENDDQFLELFDPVTYDDIFYTYDGNNDQVISYYPAGSAFASIAQNMWVSYGTKDTSTHYSFDDASKDGD